MELNKFIKLKKGLKNTDQLLKIRMIIEYFNLAKSSYKIHKEYLQKWVNDDKEEFKQKSIVGVYGLYLSGRICLIIINIINQQINTSEIKKIRSKYYKWVNDFVNFRNDFGGHPLNTKACYYSHIAGFGNRTPILEVDIYDTKSFNIIKTYKINPREDINKLSNYLEELAEVYKKNLRYIS